MKQLDETDPKSGSSSHDTQLHYGTHFRRKRVGNDFEVIVGGGQTPKSVKITNGLRMLPSQKETRDSQSNSEMHDFSRIGDLRDGKVGGCDSSITDSDD
mmetsp:Transcript_1756/g.1630  ORF Transcript_1756/g.1630 Transcript_1756/m.1630 type:complete len:99 (-) Transcript_1756:50-346(-)